MLTWNDGVDENGEGGDKRYVPPGRGQVVLPQFLRYHGQLCPNIAPRGEPQQPTDNNKHNERPHESNDNSKTREKNHRNNVQIPHFPETQVADHPIAAPAEKIGQSYDWDTQRPLGVSKSKFFCQRRNEIKYEVMPEYT